MPKILAKPDFAGIMQLLYHLGERTATGDEATRTSTECPAYRQLLPILTQSFKLPVSDLTTQSYLNPHSPYRQEVLQLSTPACEFLGVVQRCMYHNFKGHAKDLRFRNTRFTHPRSHILDVMAIFNLISQISR